MIRGGRPLKLGRFDTSINADTLVNHVAAAGSMRCETAHPRMTARGHLRQIWCAAKITLCPICSVNDGRLEKCGLS
jgi:hypothetical protein